MPGSRSPARLRRAPLCAPQALGLRALPGLPRPGFEVTRPKVSALSSPRSGRHRAVRTPARASLRPAATRGSGALAGPAACHNAEPCRSLALVSPLAEGDGARRGGAWAGEGGAGRGPSEGETNYHLGAASARARGLSGGSSRAAGPGELENPATGTELGAEFAQFSFPKTKEMYLSSPLAWLCQLFHLIKVRTLTFGSLDLNYVLCLQPLEIFPKRVHKFQTLKSWLGWGFQLCERGYRCGSSWMPLLVCITLGRAVYQTPLNLL